MYDIHKDIHTTAARERAAIVILSFHKHQQLDGSLETEKITIALFSCSCCADIFVNIRHPEEFYHLTNINILLERLHKSMLVIFPKF